MPGASTAGPSSSPTGSSSSRRRTSPRAAADRAVFRLAPGGRAGALPRGDGGASRCRPTSSAADVPASARCSSSRRHGRRHPRHADGRLVAAPTSTRCSGRCAPPPSCSSYELPIVLAVARRRLAAGIAVAHRHRRRRGRRWWLLWQLPGAVVFLVAAVAELQRPPFDMPVADSEIVFGPYTEYTGLRFAFFLLVGVRRASSSCRCCSRCSSSAAGGAARATQLGWLWTLLKGFAIALLIIWLRVAWPRLREDQLQRLAWLVAGAARPGPARADRRLGGGDA